MPCARIAAISAISQCDAGSQSIPTIDVLEKLQQSGGSGK
jgi:hypothetical protein